MEIVELVLPICPSDNRRMIPVNFGGRNRMIISPEVREYRKLAAPLLIKQWGKNKLLIPSAGHQLHIQVKTFVPNWRSDVSNYTKSLKDLFTGIIYDDDKFVHLDYLDSVKDEDNPRLVITVPIDPFSLFIPKQTNEEEKKKDGCTCNRQKLLELGWHYWELPHNSVCPSYKPLIVKRGRKITMAKQKVVVGKNAQRKRKTAKRLGDEGS